MQNLRCEYAAVIDSPGIHRRTSWFCTFTNIACILLQPIFDRGDLHLDSNWLSICSRIRKHPMQSIYTWYYHTLSVFSPGPFGLALHYPFVLEGLWAPKLQCSVDYNCRQSVIHRAGTLNGRSFIATRGHFDRLHALRGPNTEQMRTN